MANELTFQDVTNLSIAFAKSNLFGYNNSSEALSLMMLAQANGLHPAKAAERYHIIQGRPAMKADAMLASFQESGGKVRWEYRTDKACKLHLEHPQGGELDVEWTIERARAAGLTGKKTWSQFPTQMLAARCVSEGVRALYPACLCGMYTPEEVGDFDRKPANAPASVPASPAIDAPTVSAEKPAQAKPKKMPADAVDAEIVQPDYSTDAPLFANTPAPKAEPKAEKPAPKAEKKNPNKKPTQAEKDANWKAICEEKRAMAPEVYDAFLESHALKSAMDIKSSEGRAKFLAEITETINVAKGAENG